jgi:hypothetical protein
MSKPKHNGPYPVPPEVRFWKHVAKRGRGDCWEWTGAKGPPPNAYGFLLRGTVGGKQRFVRAHRLSWEIANGPVPDGASILHTCDNQGCVNPEHLYAGTQQQNVRDRAVRKRGREQRQWGAGNTNAKLTGQDVELIRKLCASGKSQAAVAELFGVKQQQVSRIVRGVSRSKG